jgi:DNA-binding CsgD family transcriptional regulator
MPNYLRLLLVLLLPLIFPSEAQSVSRAVAGDIVVAGVGVLPDRGYSWDRIHTDPTLAFRPVDSLRPAQARCYWLKLALTNPSQYTAAAELTVLPDLDNTLFYFDDDTQAWRTRRAGVAVATDSARVKGPLPLRLPGHATTPFYVLVSLNQPAALPAAVHLQVKLETAAAAQKSDFLYSIAWAVSLAVLGLLLLTNGLTYLRYRDRPTLFYISAQVGGLLYVTAYRNYFRMLLPTPIFSQLLLPTGYAYGYTINNVLMHLGVVLMLLGVVQMTRTYLATKTRLPRFDTALRYALGGYSAFSVVVALVNVSGFLLNYYTLRLDNLLVFGVIGVLLATTVIAYRRRLPLARTYLLANVLPLLCVLAVATYHVAVGFGGDSVQLLPDLAIVSHAFFFSAAISARLQIAQRTLLATEREAASLALDIRQQELRNREIVLKNQHIQTALREMQRRQQTYDKQTQQLSADHHHQQIANYELQQQLEANQRELASTTLYVQQKNALLAELKQQLQELHTQSPNGRSQELAGVQSLLQSSLYLDEDWGRFKLHFEQVHPRFFEDLQARYPALTSHEQRLYCYFHINLSTKEIAALLNIDPASVRRAKTRLYKKIAATDEAAGRPTAGDAAELREEA